MSRSLSQEDCHQSPDVNALIVASHWLSGLFSAPLSQQQVIDARTAPGQDGLRWIGAQLDATATADTLCRTLAQDTVENLTVRLQRNYTTLFEGIFADRSVLPYESAWQDQQHATLGGVAVVEMNILLRNLDMHISADCCEPADHLAIELAALATALDTGHNNIAQDLLRRLRDWTPAFSQALQRQDPNGLYALAGQLLLALTHAASITLMPTMPVMASVNQHPQGEC